MAAMRLTRFVDPAFLGQINEDEQFRELLAPWRKFFKANGLPLAKLIADPSRGGDGFMKLMAESESNDIPADLVDLLYSIEGMADEAGHDLILEEAELQGVQLESQGKDLSHVDFAVAAWLEREQLVRNCKSQVEVGKVKRFQAFRGESPMRLNRAKVARKQRQLENEFGEWFNHKNRTSACEIYAFEDQHELIVQISHGQSYRQRPAYDGKMKPSPIRFRPRKTDWAIYDNRTGILLVNATTEPEKKIIAEYLGKHLCGSATHFRGENVFDLTPMAKRRRFPTVNGIEEITWTEIQTTGPGKINLRATADDILQHIEQGHIAFPEGSEITFAAFKVRMESNRVRRKVSVWRNRIEFNRNVEAPAVEAMLTAIGLIPEEIAEHLTLAHSGS